MKKENQKRKPPVNLFKQKPIAFEKSNQIKSKEITAVSGGLLVKNLLAESELVQINAEMDACEWIPVGINGILEDYQKNKDQQVGSYRASSFDPAFAENLWAKLSSLQYFQETDFLNSATDRDGSRFWQAVGINPLFRFIRYKQSGALVPHYDGPFVQDSKIRTMKTLVVYLRDSGAGGATRFIRDPQEKIALKDKHYNDWQRFALKEEVLERIPAQAGSGLIFDHRVLHDSEAIGESAKADKIILRTDIFYERQA